LGEKALLTIECCEVSPDFYVEQCCFAIAYVDPIIAGKAVSKQGTQQFSWHWHMDDESTLPAVTSIVDITIFQSYVLQTQVCQSPAGHSESYWVASRSLIEMVVHTPEMLPQCSVILLPDG
jgi:hypothetical protein